MYIKINIYFPGTPNYFLTGVAPCSRYKRRGMSGSV